MRILIVATLAMVLIVSRGEAQGALSTQGLGYPTGEMSARAEGTGGAVADFDVLSLVSPASIAGVGAAALFFQYSPEFRRVTAGSGTATTTTARFPLVSGILPLGQSWALGLSSSTFLDRSSETSLVRRRLVGADSVNETETNKVLGAIDDVRLALAWSGTPKIRIGGGFHVFSGSNRVTLSQLFPDSAKYTSTSETERLSFNGLAASVGIEFHPSRVIGFAFAGRKGGNLTAARNDTTIGEGRIPDHYSASVSYDGITGANISARVARDNWSSLSSIGPNVQGFDSWDYSLGAEASGPRVMQRLVVMRAGARVRTLPFGFNGQKVSETSLMAGLGIPLARDRAAFDFTLQHAARSASGVSERGLILSFGLRVTP
ncbi:MAG: hypothetical protein QOD47_2487 [Gemmatimonadaceae bacterium]|jgi:hypothetical protein|nr:hypothetical protein [Gemmatimonadaceae bacterium]